MALELSGRDTELDSLRTWVGEARAGQTRLVVISGDAGIGKSSLLDASIREARSADGTVAVGRVVEGVGAPPYWPIRQLLATLGATDLLPVDDPSDEVPGDRFLRFEAVREYVEGIARGSDGLLLAIDDLHRADPATQRLVAHLLLGTVDAPMMFVATTRSDPTDLAPGVADLLVDLSRHPGARRIDLGPLGRDAIRDLLPESCDDALVDRVVALTDGNALFCTELARHLSTGGDPDDVPRSIRDIVTVRLAARSAACREALEAASLAGREFAVGLLATVLARPSLQVLDDMDEAVDAGLIEATDIPGRFRFVHLLVRDAIEASVSRSGRVELHRRLAQALETYEGSGIDHVAAIADHWDDATIDDDTRMAATWQERAGLAAERVLAWEEAAARFERAADLGGIDGDPVDRHRRLLAAARSRLHVDDPAAVAACCELAAEAADRAGRPELLAESALVFESRSGSVGSDTMSFLALADRALRALPEDEHALRARVLGQLSTLCFYVEPTRCEPLSEEAIRESQLSDDPLAIVAATRARQMLRLGPDHTGERLDLADRLGRAAEALGRVDIQVWENVWRIDTFFELGRIREIPAELAVLRHRAATIGQPMTQWHVLRTECALAVAEGRWDDALRFGTQSRDLYATHEDPLGAIGMEMAIGVGMGVNTGFPPDVLDRYDTLDERLAPAFIGDIPTLGHLTALVALGRVEEAHTRYSRVAPVEEWRPPEFLWLPIHVLRLAGAIALGRLEDVGPLLERLAPHRGAHVAGGGGPMTYHGPVDLHLGEGALAIGRFEDAVVDLRAALEVARHQATPPFEVRAAALLAEALVGRDGAGDRNEARDLLVRHRPLATALAMEPWIRRLDALDRRLGDRPPQDESPLSARELEVAELVADGLTNNEIADRLFVSQRTAQNHVQHILTKLAFNNRTQIATWFQGRG